MTQIAAKCPGVIQFCRTRITELDADGSPTDTFYVSDKEVSLAVTPDIDAGQRRTVRSGCDCVVVTQRSSDVLLGHTFELVDGVWEPALEALMLGYDAIYNTDVIPRVIGYNVSGDQLTCGGVQPKVALEAWSYAWDGQGQDADLGLIHHLWPMTTWQQAAATYSVEATTPGVTGWSQRNDNWDDPYNDLPTDGTFVFVSNFYTTWMEATTALPDADCAYQTIPA